MHRYFKVCKGYDDLEVLLPTRCTARSAGYDFFAPKDVVVPSIWKAQNILGLIRKKIQPTIVWTHVKARMYGNEYLALHNRSSNPKKFGLILANGVGIVDADYYGNPDNDGDIGFAFYNILPWDVLIRKGTRIGQGIFQTFLKVDSDMNRKERTGGFGSTDN